MNFDCVSFIDWLMPIMFWLGFTAGAGIGFLASAIIAITFLLRGGKDDAS